MKILINKDSNSPLYKQIVEFIISCIISGKVSTGEILPSMNELAEELDISKETVKKAYAVLRDLRYIEPKQGKGFFICNPEETSNKRILVLFDKLSTYKEILFNAMAAEIGKEAQITILLHNQNIDLLEYYLNENLDKYDYYVITPHFALDDSTQKRVVKQINRIPNRKLIMLDHWLKDIPGNYGAVYQDFSHDIYDGLSQGLDKIRKIGKLNVITLPSSLYHSQICLSIKRFCRDNDINVTFQSSGSKNLVEKGGIYLLLNSQLDTSLLDIVKEAKRKKLEIGKDFYIISYNESPINELVLGGLTTVSSDFALMGRMAARMILNQTISKEKCPFRMIRRATF